MVFLQPQRPEISERIEDEPGDGGWVLESDGQRQVPRKCREDYGAAEDSRLLQRTSTPRSEDSLDHARVSPLWR